MAYGTVKVDNITFDQGGADQNVTASGIYRAITSGVTVSGTIAGAVLIGTTTVSGTTVTGTTANFASGVFTTQVSGATVTGTQSSFTSGNFVTLSGATATFTSGVIASGTAAAPSLSILGDANTGIYSPGADQVAISTNGTGRLFVDASGDIGIATSTPNTQGYGGSVLGIFGSGNNGGNIWLTSETTAAGNRTGRIGFGTEGNTVNKETARIWSLVDGSTAGNLGGNLLFNTKSDGGALTERMRLDSSGQLGLGTSSPNYQLHVTTDFAVGASGFNQQLSFTNDTIQSLLLGTGYTALKLNPLGGNVGIGTSSPGSKLEVGGESAPRVGINSTGTGTAGVLFQGTGTTYGSIIENIFTGELAIKAGASGQNSYFITFGTNDGTERARIDSSGRLLVGTSTARASANGVSAGLQVEGTGAEGALSVIRNGGLAYLTLGRSGGASVGSNTAISNNDELGRISWAAADGTDIQSWAAQISAEIDGTPGSNDTPGRLVFSTTADGAASPTERMRIKSNGTINFSNVATYADNTAALAGGLVAGDVYRKSDGTLMITY